MYRSIKLITSVLFVLFLFNGCLKKEPVTIGFLIHDLDKERWESDRDFFVKEVEAQGGVVEVRVANNDADKQLEQANELLSKGVRALVVIPVHQFDAAEIVEVAHAKRVKVISYDRLIKNCEVDYYISTDNIKIGELQAGYLTKIKPKGKYALIGGAVNDLNSQFLYLGQMNVLQPLVLKGDISIVYNVFTNFWAEDEGYEHARLLLEQYSDVDAIVAGNDNIALGVIRALHEANKEDDVLVTGMDADTRNLEEIAAGHQTMTIYKPYEKLATTAADIAMQLGKSEEMEDIYQTVSNGKKLVPTIYHDALIIDKGNLKLSVISESLQKGEDVAK